MDQKAVHRAEQQPREGRRAEDRDPAEGGSHRFAAPHEDRRDHILRDRGRRGEGDVDSAGNEDGQQPGRHDPDKGVAVQQIEEIAPREKAVGLRAEKSDEEQDHPREQELPAQGREARASPAGEAFVIPH